MSPHVGGGFAAGGVDMEADGIAVVDVVAIADVVVDADGGGDASLVEHPASVVHHAATKSGMKAREGARLQVFGTAAPMHAR